MIAIPIYDYKCVKCSYQSTEFVWRLDGKVFCPLCHKQMAKIFTGSFAELKSKRNKPRSYNWEPQECNATKDIFESCKHDFEKGKATKNELEYWKKEVKKENPNLII